MSIPIRKEHSGSNVSDSEAISTHDETSNSDNSKKITINFDNPIELTNYDVTYNKVGFDFITNDVGTISDLSGVDEDGNEVSIGEHTERFNGNHISS